MKLGIVGLPNVGKSTLFNAITNAGAESANYAFCTIEPNVGMVSVPDERMPHLQAMYDSKRIVPAVIEFVDIAGLVKGASEGEGLGNKFLAHIREVDAILHVVRCFDSENIIHVEGSVDPARDIETINLELVFSDLDLVQRRGDRSRRAMMGDKTLAKEVAFLDRLIAHLEDGKTARSIEMTKDERAILYDMPLLSSKPVIYACNMGEDDFKDDISKNKYVSIVQKIALEEGAEVLPISAEIEAEIANLEDDEKALFLDDIGLGESGLARLIQSSYRLLGLLSYLTAGEQEIRAWTVRKGAKSPEAAGKIHSDIERGFIRAEVIAYDELMKYTSIVDAREHGKVRSEGKEYIVQDGDVVLFRFNV